MKNKKKEKKEERATERGEKGRTEKGKEDRDTETTKTSDLSISNSQEQIVENKIRGSQGQPSYNKNRPWSRSIYEFLRQIGRAHV